MGAAAGAAVRPGEGDDAHLTGEFLLAAVVQLRQLLRQGAGDLHRPVRPDGLVSQSFRLQGLVPGDVGVVVDGHRLRPQVEAHIVAVKFFAQDAGDDVLSGVLLHMVKPADPVDGSHHHRAGFHRTVAGVENHAVSLMDIRHTHAAQGAVVRRLSAPLGIEGGAVQSHPPAVLRGLTGLNRGGKFPQKGVLVVQFFCLHDLSPHSIRPRACFHVNTRRQALLTTSSGRPPFSTASITWEIWAR